MLENREEALQLLAQLGASPRLMHHAEVVSEVAGLLASQLQSVGIACDARLVALGAALHDAGKISHPEELFKPGMQHEQAGQALLLLHKVPAEVARFCISHARWHAPGVTLEERIVALADKLWKGQREEDLELSIIDDAASRLSVVRWDVFNSLDNGFEDIAAAGAMRIEQSRSK